RVRDSHQHRQPAADLVRGHLQDKSALLIREEAELPGGPEYEDAIHAGSDETIQMAPERCFIDGRAVSSQGCTHRDHDTGQWCSHRTRSSFSPRALSAGDPMSNGGDHSEPRRSPRLSATDQRGEGSPGSNRNSRPVCHGTYYDTTRF